MRKIAILLAGAEESEARSRITAFQQELARLGWASGTDVLLEERWANDDMARVRTLAAALVQSKPDIIVINGVRAIRPVMELTSEIPILMTGITDPVESGLVKSLSHPGGNVTGIAAFEYAITGKLLEALVEIAPSLKRVALVFNPANASAQPRLKELQALAASLPVDVFPVLFRNGSELEKGIAEFGRAPGGLLFGPDVSVPPHKDAILSAADRLKLPAIYPYRSFSVSGGLMSYGMNYAEIWRHTAGYADRILRGQKPADLPVENARKFEFVINLRTAKRLGLTVSPSLLTRADEVIE